MPMTKKLITTTIAALVAASLILPMSAEAQSKKTKNTVGGAVVGAGVGYLVGGSDGAKAGAVVGAIAGYKKKR
jgi:outer membrane lipoprotein SlyB